MFEFKGDWGTQIALKALSCLINNPEYGWESVGDKTGIVEIKIFDVRNENPDPETFQLNSINYLLQEVNQNQILRNLFDYSKNMIYPNYKAFLSEEEYPECYPSLKVLKDLEKLYRIHRVLIKTIEKDDFAYFIFECSSCLDHEHGITITFYKNEIIDHGEDWEDKKVCAHKGIDYKSYSEKSQTEYNLRVLELASPHPKYGKLKPFQQDQNEYYPFGLYHKKQDQRLKDELTEGIIENVRNVISRLLSLAIRDERNDLMNFFLERESQSNHTAFMEALTKDRFDILDKLLEIGYNINEYVAQSSPFYYTIDALEKKVSTNSNYDNITDRLEYLLKNGLNPNLEDRWGRDSFYRIQRIEAIEVREKVEEIINGILTKM